MPHITALSGPSNEADYPVAVTVRTSRAHLILDDTTPPVAEPETAGVDSEEESCPGGNSTPSTSKQPSSSSSGEPSPSQPAPTTVNPSPSDPTGSGSADSTDGPKPTEPTPTSEPSE